MVKNIHGFFNPAIINDMNITLNDSSSFNKRYRLAKMYQSAFIKYKNANNIINDDLLVKLFIEDYKPNLAVVSSGSKLPAYLLVRVKEKIIDQLSGEHVYILDWI